MNVQTKGRAKQLRRNRAARLRRMRLSAMQQQTAVPPSETGRLRVRVVSPQQDEQSFAMEAFMQLLWGTQSWRRPH